MSKFKPSPGRTATLSEPVAAAPSVRQTSSAGKTVSSLAGNRTEKQIIDNRGEDAPFRFAVLNTTRKIALYSTLVFIFFRFSFLHEFLSSKYRLDLHVLLIFGAISTLACLISGLFLAGFGYAAIRMWLLFFLCMCVATAFSSWRGGSVNVLIPYLRTTLPLVLLIPGIAYTAGDIKKVINTIGIAGATTIFIGLINDDFRTGRLELDSRGGSIANANDYAAHMILVLPAIAYCMLHSGRNIFVKVFGTAVLAIGCYQLLGTGSRGGLVAIIVTGLFIFVKGSSRLRFGLILGIPVLCAFILPLLPGGASQRLASLFNSKDETAEAAESRMGRTALLEASLKITFTHPLFGIGPGEFQDYQGGQAAAQGQRGLWHETHNGYTQISSECGIPAIGFYLAAMIITFRSLQRAAKAKVAQISAIARTLSIMMVGFSVCLLFLSQGYSFVLLVISGIAVCIERLLAQQAAAAPTLVAR